MNKLIALVLSFSLVFGSVTPSLAQQNKIVQGAKAIKQAGAGAQNLVPNTIKKIPGVSVGTNLRYVPNAPAIKPLAPYAPGVHFVAPASSDESTQKLNENLTQAISKQALQASAVQAKKLDDIKKLLAKSNFSEKDAKEIYDQIFKVERTNTATEFLLLNTLPIVTVERGFALGKTQADQALSFYRNLLLSTINAPVNLPETASLNDLFSYSGRMYNANRLNYILQEENEWAEEANSSRIVKIIITVIICLIIFGVLLFFAIKNIRILLKVKPVVPTTHFDYFRDLPRENCSPAEALYILDGKYQGFTQYDIGKVFSSTILNLSLKKLIKIEEIPEGGKKDSKITILSQEANNVTLNSDEIIILNFLNTACKNKSKSIFGGSKETDNPNEITMKELKKYISNNSSKVVLLKNAIDKAIKSKLTSNRILDLKGIKRRNANMAGCSIGVFIPFVLVFLLDNMEFVTNTVNSIGIPWYLLGIALIWLVVDFILINRANNRISVYTQEGVDEQDKWKAFKKYMEDFSLLKEKNVPDLAIWEKYLVYATAFGISEKVIKELKIVYPDFDNYDYNIYPTIFIMSHMDFSSSFRSVSNAMSSSFSSGSGGGGGFSGGGGRWRRPAVVGEEGKPSSFFFFNFFHRDNSKTKKHIVLQQ